MLALYFTSRSFDRLMGGPRYYLFRLVIDTSALSLPLYSTHLCATSSLHRFSWVFEVSSSAYDAAAHQTTFNFSQTRGGNQGSRGGNAGQVGNNCAGRFCKHRWRWIAQAYRRYHC